MKLKNKKVVVGLSGGVDSAAVVKILKAKGCEVIGVFLQMHSEGEKMYRVTYGQRDGNDIKSAFQCACAYDIPLYVYNSHDSFNEYVIKDFLEEYSHGRTPNPCTVCNYYCKIHSLIKASELLNADYAATGHYAGIGYENGRYFPYMGKDTKKDQSYMLWKLSQKQLSKLIFPLCEYEKGEIKDFASRDKLLAAEKKESTDICFIPDGDYASYIEKRLGKFPEGIFLGPDGKECGKHKGIIHYTVGQRKGLNISYGKPLFVKKIDSEKNTIHLGIKGEEYSSGFTAEKLNFCLLEPKENIKLDCCVKIRYSAPATPCHAEICGDNVKVTFDTPQRAVTPGQSAVFYDGNKVLFGGVIK